LPHARALVLIGCCCWLGWNAAHARAEPHALDPLTQAELRQSFAILRAHLDQAGAELPQQDWLVPLLALREPDKRAHDASTDAGTSKPPRRAEAQLLHWPSNRTWLAELDLDANKLSAWSLAAAGTQPALSGEEYEVAAKLLREHAPWQSAVRARGAKPELAHIDAWAPGHVELSEALVAQLSHGRSTRLVRCLSFEGGTRADRGRNKHARSPLNPYARPLDGLVALIDLNARRVVQLYDVMPEQPVSTESGNAARPAARAKPLIAQQPQGSDIQIAGHEVRWGGWQFRVALHPREGLVLYDVQVKARGQLRPVAARLSLSEIYVPYGFGDHEWTWRSAFDVGEYNPGTLAHELEPNRDVPENARFLPATLGSSRGLSTVEPRSEQHWKRAIALYERDAGMLWSRTDPVTGARDTRLARELVVTWSSWIGNYIYGFEWIFKQDGSLEVRIQLTGSTLNRSFTARAERSAPKVGKDAAGVWMAAPNHQHFFSFRLDLDVDGSANHVMESELRALREGGFQNAFEKYKTALASEGPRDAAANLERRWCVMSNTQRNVLGEAPAYTLEPGATIQPYSSDSFPGLLRAQFAKHALWVTRYAPGELFAAGRFPSQAEAADGVSRYVSPAEPLTPEQGSDVVLWYTLGLSHVPRLEDYPVMNSESIAFRLAPHGFFDQNPALDIADQAR
jgi:primary-amine oxidase